ncbi:hypothetical protein ACEU6E_02940 [Halorutilales archaeon Cl-col2-1]
MTPRYEVEKKERIGYQAWKSALQKLTSSRSSNQLEELSATDWDILIVLDACRVDVLEGLANWPVDSVVSPASCTPEWIGEVSSSRVLSGSRVVSANPQYEKVDADLGCEEIEPYWETHWDDDLQTTVPEQVLDRVSEISQNSSGRVVGHLQQPHWPYIAKLGDRWLLAYDELGPWNDDEEITSLQVAMQRGLVDVEMAKKAYESSIHSVWNVLKTYLAEWVSDGNNVVVTADHGETFGRYREFGFYEHPCRCHVAPLVRVPWIEVRADDGVTETSDTVGERLQALGYAE